MNIENMAAHGYHHLSRAGPTHRLTLSFCLIPTPAPGPHRRSARSSAEFDQGIYGLSLRSKQNNRIAIPTSRRWCDRRRPRRRRPEDIATNVGSLHYPQPTDTSPPETPNRRRLPHPLPVTPSNTPPRRTHTAARRYTAAARAYINIGTPQL